MRSKSHTNSPFHAEKIVPVISSSAQEMSVAERAAKNPYVVKRPLLLRENGLNGANPVDPRSLSLNGLDSLNAPSLNALSRTPPVNASVADQTQIKGNHLELDNFVEKR
ncbi:hypothetical protein QE152_g5914 [Popillia japonica]|uniref:Uncharacterized protein n=1 Tax=Popillia japonica TaxID=7064 RepID=A0AAW1MIU2_POPJA